MHRAEKLIALEKMAEQLGREFGALIPPPDRDEWRSLQNALRHPERQSLEVADVLEAEARRVYDNIQDDLERERSE